MTYAQDEASTEDADPVELYEFIGAAQTFRFTSAEQDIVFDTGGGVETFSAIPINRSGISNHEDGGAPELSVTLPITTDLAERYVFQIAPPSLSLRLFRVQQTSGFSIKYWEGPVLGWSVKERMIAFRVSNALLSRINDEIPSLKYQTLCNNVLYDRVCGLGQLPFEILNILGPLIGDQKTLTVNTMGAFPDGFMDGGELIHVPTGESRMILSHVGTTLLVLWPFSSNVDAGDQMRARAGCDHSLDACVNKFANEDNFNGMAFLSGQGLNPTQGGE